MEYATNPFASGFLSEAVREVRAEVRHRHADLARLLDDVNARAVRSQHVIDIRRGCPAELYGAALFARTIASTQAAVLLLEYGLPSQARTVLRAALETLFSLGAVSNRPDLAEDLLASHQADRRTVAERIPRWRDPALRAAVERHTRDAKLAEVLAIPGKSLNQYELAKLAEMED